MEQNYPVLEKVIIVSLFVFVASSMFSISVTQIACGLGGLAWILRTHLTGTWEEQRWPVGIPFLLYASACLIAVANAYDMSYSYKSLKKLLEILIFFWVLNCVQSTRLRDSLSLTLIVSATLAGLFGLYQAWMHGANIENRLEGTMSVYMTFAGVLLLVGMLALGRAIFQRPLKFWIWPAIGTISVCLLLTFARQAWFGFLIGLVFLIFIWKRTLVLILAGMALTIIIIYGNQLQSQVMSMTDWQRSGMSFQEHMKYRINRMISGEDEGFQVRVGLWQVGWEIFKDYPLTGCGFRCVDLVNEQYPDPLREKYHDPIRSVKHIRGMHNNFAQIAVDTGILGLTAWLGIWICFFRLLYHRAKALKKDPHECWVVYGSTAAGLAFLAGGCFETNFYDSEVAMVLFFIMALPFTGSQSERYNLCKRNQHT